MTKSEGTAGFLWIVGCFNHRGERWELPSIGKWAVARTEFAQSRCPSSNFGNAAATASFPRRALTSAPRAVLFLGFSRSRGSDQSQGRQRIAQPPASRSSSSNRGPLCATCAASTSTAGGAPRPKGLKWNSFTNRWKGVSIFLNSYVIKWTCLRLVALCGRFPAVERPFCDQ